LAAVEHLGPEARSYANWLRDTYPNATPDGLARLATRRFVRQARNRGAAAGMSGPLALLVEAGGLGWLHARLVLHLAAAYGLDPTSPARAAELLVLQQVHGSIDTAEAAIEAATTAVTEAPRRLISVGRAVGAGALRAGVARAASKFVPGGAAIVGALTGARSTERLAVRAIRYYRAARTRSPHADQGEADHRRNQVGSASP
jgi:hypothetical protein